MNSSLFFIVLLCPLICFVFNFGAEAAPAGPLIKHLSSLVKWSRSSPRTSHQSDANAIQFEDGYLVETVVEGNELGMVPYSIRVSHDGELFAVDAINSNIVRITPPLSQYSRARLVAGSFQGQTGHVDGKPTEVRFNHPKGVTMDDKGNIYVADTSNLAIRKIGEAGVTTIAGGKSNIPGYRDGPSEDAKFSSDFDVVYVRPTCSLLVIDRGNAAIRRISLSKEDCGYENSSVSSTDLLMVAGAILIGYVSCTLQQGFGSSFFSNTVQNPLEQGEGKLDTFSDTKEAPVTTESTATEEREANWPSFGQLIYDLSKFAMESLTGFLPQLSPSRLKGKITARKGLTPLKDSLVMPEDEAQPPPGLKSRAPNPMSETRQARGPVPPDGFSEVKANKARSSSLKDPSLSTTKHRSSKRQEFAEYYGSSEAPQARPKSHKERSKHRAREKSGDSGFGAYAKQPGEVKPTSYESPKFDAFNFRSKYGDSYRYD